MIERSDAIFRSPDLLIRGVAGGGDVAFVSFDCYTEQDTVDRPGFGEVFFEALGIPAFHILHRRNHWFQHPELPEALAALRPHLAGYRKVVVYGSSMGGFAALAYGSLLGAHIGLALSPQYSVDPKVAPFESRWRADIRRIRFLKPDRAPPLPRQFIAFDPADAADARHAALFADRSPTVLIPARHGGHPVGAFLNETGVLRALIDRLVTDDDDSHLAAEMIARLRAGRRSSGQYLFGLARRIPMRRLRSKLAVAKLASDTGVPVYQSHYAALLDQCGRHSEALAIHRLACAHPDPNPAAFWNLMAHHVALGQEGEAERIAREGLRRYPRSPQLRRKLRILALRRRLRLDRLAPSIGRRVLLGA
ncbi:pimeloyl-ACP methyl ester carboxylesterase [Sphingomonas vulcanisoli]|uniref:Pimeloyl-ACP methyl ester carboxylesterase n=1 Tax=Sphingomonas vulcanisoli TaxID=1658060 RepID=A0ABX0TTG4_9SPHN|nr:pimeloyl-ACP methyl ester carboxylesterase [Sphingomonas vulcanisoli]